MSASTDIDEERGPAGAAFWSSLVVGGGVVVFALVQLHATSSDRGLHSAVAFLAAAGIAHDALWAPAVVLVGAATAAVVPGWARGPVRLGLAFSALVVLVAWPELRGYGARPRNPSLLPLDYDRGLAIVLSGIWVAVVSALVARAWRRRGTSRR